MLNIQINRAKKKLKTKSNRNKITINHKIESILLFFFEEKRKK